MLHYHIGPSILDADLSALADVCQRLVSAGSDYLHLDVMDGQFVPNLTFGHPIVRCLRPKIPDHIDLETHMMVDHPERWIEPMQNAGVAWYTFHYEATDDVVSCIRKVKEAGMRCGLAIKPKTAVEVVLPFVEQVDQILIMTVEPGFGGQSFMSDMMPKVRTLRSAFPELNIEVDGGVNTLNVDACLAAGVNRIVSGSAITRSPDPAAVIAQLKSHCAKYVSGST